MNRDEALKVAIASKCLSVVFQGAVNQWHVYTYTEYKQLAPFTYDPTTRYVLPNGEVTKLS